MAVTADDALQLLTEGNARYTADKCEHPNLSQSRRAETTGGQSPYAVVLACADSRVTPELIFDAGIGDLFVTTVAGNIASPEVTGTIEYAALHLDTRLVVVMGHQSCGAVTAAVDGSPHGNSIDSLVNAMQGTVAKAKDQAGDQVDNTIRQNAHDVCADLIGRSPAMAELVEAGTLKIVPAYYALDTGAVSWL